MTNAEAFREIVIREAGTEDAAGLLNIYAPYVLETAITFEYQVPSEAEFKERIRRILDRYPYIVAEADGKIIGYAYAGAFGERAAYDRAAEVTVYVEKSRRKSGAGKALYTALEKILTYQNVLNVNACIAYPEQEDEYLTKNSAQFHEHMGYSLAGRFHKCGYKFGRWYDMIWMEKFLGEHREIPLPFRPFSEIRGEIYEKLVI